jgi:predicted acyltransferase
MKPDLTKKERFIALDVFRGMTICFMIIVNTPGSFASPFAPLEHAEWHGFTPTDLVFPSFLFAVGNAMSFSLERFRAMGDAAFFSKVIKRTLLIFLLGYLMYWFPFFRLDPAGHIIGAPIGHTRIMGVLQRIALCYFFASVMIYYLKRRTVIIITLLLFVIYWATLLLFGDAAQPYSILGNAGLRLDKLLMGPYHMYHGEDIPFDPEGWLSTLPAIGNVVAGYYAGKYIQEKGKNYEMLTKLMLLGSLFIFLALWWNNILPINKKLWTPSYVFLTTGIDLVLISGLIYIIEMQGRPTRRWEQFFIVFGKNPLFIYLLSELFVTILFMIRIHNNISLFAWVNKVFFQVIAPGAVGSLLFAVTYMLFCWSVGWWLNRRRIFIRV